jgi:acetyl-CoA acetyltransferase
MNPPGAAELLVAARAALLDALQALVLFRDAVVVIGAQAVYLHTGAAATALAEATKDSDLALDPRLLAVT